MYVGLFPANIKERWANAGSRYGIYASEVLAHAGLPVHTLNVDSLSDELLNCAVLVLPTQLALSEAEQALIADYVEKGGALVGLGGTSGLDNIFGCQCSGTITEAWMDVDDQTHPLTGGISGALHAFGGCLLTVNTAGVLGYWCYPKHEVTAGPALTVNRFGNGWAVLLAADVMQTIVRIQQGRSVHVDGTPASDGSASVDDGILKTDDGIVLDYDIDRSVISGVPIFAQPITDEWRELVIRATLWAAWQQGTALPMLWYWPDNIPAIGQISHDSDGNVPASAEFLLKQLQELEIPSTWCIQYPGGYAPDFYMRLHEQGYEVALHFDARSDLPRTAWEERHLRQQLEWLQDISGLKINSNKNHYLRWEGLTQFFIWLERLGVASDQTKGPTKTGVAGYPFGGSHPWFPLEEQQLRFIDVLEIPHQTWELNGKWPLAVGEALVDQAVAHAGVAHFLFHPGIVAKSSRVSEALTSIVQYGRQCGLQWWTNNMIQDWERRRRQVRFTATRSDEAIGWRVESEAQLDKATFLLFDPNVQHSECGAEATVQRFGLTAKLVVADLAPNQPMQLPCVQ
jgi:hypothetical protein